MDRIIKLTRLEQLKETIHSNIEIGDSVEGKIIESSAFPKKPTVGLPFVIDTYRTSVVKQILTEDTFRTNNSVYKFEFLN